MITLAWYILKVIVASGILSAYYFIALRNKAFHGWNRFYLLASVFISLVSPLITINVFKNNDTDNGKVISILRTINAGDEAINFYNKNSSIHLTVQNLVESIYILVTVVFFIIFFITLYRIQKLKQNYPLTKLDEINFFSTNAKGTPFSFFNSIFWNIAIDLNSHAGQQIFNHEVAHVKEKHSYDKICMNALLIFFWINPFFWLMRKELNMIHEFIADKKAVENSGLSGFAEMILNTVYPSQNFSLTNHFFYSPLKRRIRMLTKNKNPKVNYLSRLIALPIAAIIFFGFTIHVKSINNNVTPAISSEISGVKMNGNIDTMPALTYKKRKVKDVSVMQSAPKVTVTFEDGSSETITEDEAKQNGLLMPPPPPPAPAMAAPPAPASPISPVEPKMPPPPPPPPLPANVLYIINGKVSTVQAVKSIDPSNISSINVLKDTSAKNKYGDKAKYGAIEIFTKAQAVNSNDALPDKVFTRVEQPASFPGGYSEWLKYITGAIQKNINLLMSDKNNTGTCVVKFIVNTDGSISNVEATTMKETKLSGVATDALKQSPKWTPGKQNDHIVASYVMQPVSFKVSDDIPKQEKEKEPQ